MNIGIFAKTFVKPLLEAVLDAVHQHELTQVQFNMSCAGLSALPDFIDPVIEKKFITKHMPETFKSLLFQERLI